MCCRGVRQLREPDGDDFFAIDGNPKLQRRTWSVPFAEVLFCTKIDMFARHACPNRPSGTSSQQGDSASRCSSFRRCQCVSAPGRIARDETKLAADSATRADAKICERRSCRLQLRAEGSLRGNATHIDAPHDILEVRSRVECVVHELKDTESLSQRSRFLATLAARVPRL